MFSAKKNVLQTVALIKAYGIRHIVLSPGSRNAPLVQTFTQDGFFECQTIVDERSAAFHALGIIQCTRQPVVVCCTSGSAVLNCAPAVSEAYYQQLPLIVLSADRSPEWIGQMDGQTMPQPNVFGTLSKKSVNLPEIKTDADEWYCNRLVNEALIACTKYAPAPVHINIPLGEPLFDYSIRNLPEVRKIDYIAPKKTVDVKTFAEKWKSLPRRMIIVGQMFPDSGLNRILEKLVQKTDCIVLTESLSNCSSPFFISNFDTLLYALTEENKKEYTPDLVITIGGHIVSKRLKHLLRQNKPANHWHINSYGDEVDLFQSLTNIIEADIQEFLNDLTHSIPKDTSKPYFNLWRDSSGKIKEPETETPFSDVYAIGKVIKSLPENSIVHLANSSTPRNVQLYHFDESLKIFCNRGINGIEGTLPTAIGFASVTNNPVYLITGDLSFFYSVGALWNTGHIKNLRIILINNGGGGIFHLLPGLNKSSSLEQFVSASHTTHAKKWASAAEMEYFLADNKNELSTVIGKFINSTNEKSALLEISTDTETSKKVFTDYYHKIKNSKLI